MTNLDIIQYMCLYDLKHDPAFIAGAKDRARLEESRNYIENMKGFNPFPKKRFSTSGAAKPVIKRVYSI